MTKTFCVGGVITCWLLAAAAAAGSLEVTIHGTHPPGSVVHWGLYADEAAYHAGEVLRDGREPAQGASTVLRLPDLAPGRYCMAVFLDLDGDQEIDMSWIGLPQEPFGFSNDAVGTVGMPSFEATAFAVGASTTRITLTLREP